MPNPPLAGSNTDSDTVTEFSDAQDGGASGSVDRVALRLPPFWPDDPEVWFGQAEAHFLVSGIKDDSTKFYSIIAQLDHRYAKEIKSLIKNPPKTDKYLRLKTELTKCLSISREQQIREVLSSQELGDRKPSQFLRHLITMADGGVSDEFLRSMWMTRLPAHVQPYLISQTNATLENLADLADKICEATTPAAPFQVAATSNYDGLLQRIDDLITTRIKTELNNQIAQLSLHSGRSRSRFRRSESNSRSKSRGRSRSKTPGMCWYHSIFAEKARKCTPPCNYSQGNARGSQ